MRVSRSVVIGFLVGLVATASVAWGDDRFTDVPATNPHHANVALIAKAGISVGCTQSSYCPSTKVRREQMASFLARTAGLGANVPVASTRTPLQSYCALANRSPGAYGQGPCAQQRRVFDLGANAFGLDMIIGFDGRPMVLYRDTAATALKRLSCDNPACTTGSVATLDTYPAGNEGAFVRILAGRGRPEVAYGVGSDGRDGACADHDCAALASAPSTSAGVRFLSSDTLYDQRPFYGEVSLIAYKRDSRLHLRADDTGHTADGEEGLGGPDVGDHPTALWGRDGRGVVSYSHATDGVVKVAHCDDEAGFGNDHSCKSSTKSTIGPGSMASMVIATDGFPLVVFHDHVGGRLMIGKCADVECASVTVNALDTGGVGSHADVAVGFDGKPVIVYRDDVSNDLKIAYCADAACSSAQTDVLDATLEPVGGSGAREVTIAIGIDGAPVVAYRGALGWPRIMRLATR